MRASHKILFVQFFILFVSCFSWNVQASQWDENFTRQHSYARFKTKIIDGQDNKVRQLKLEYHGKGSSSLAIDFSNDNAAAEFKNKVQNKFRFEEKNPNRILFRASNADQVSVFDQAIEALDEYDRIETVGDGKPEFWTTQSGDIKASMKEFISRIYDMSLNPIHLATVYQGAENSEVDATSVLRVLDQALAEFDSQVGSKMKNQVVFKEGLLNRVENRQVHTSVQKLHDQILQALMKIRAIKKELEQDQSQMLSNSSEELSKKNKSRIDAIDHLLQQFQSELDRIYPDSKVLEGVKDGIICESDVLSSKFHPYNSLYESSEFFFGGPPSLHSDKDDCKPCALVRKLSEKFRKSTKQVTLELADLEKLVALAEVNKECQHFYSASYHANELVLQVSASPLYEEFIYSTGMMFQSQRGSFLRKLGFRVSSRKAETQIFSALEKASKYEKSDDLINYYSSVLRLTHLCKNKKTIEAVLNSALALPENASSEKKIQFLLTGLSLTGLIEGTNFDYGPRSHMPERDTDGNNIPQRGGYRGGVSGEMYDQYLREEQNKRARERKYHVEKIDPELRDLFVRLVNRLPDPLDRLPFLVYVKGLLAFDP